MRTETATFRVSGDALTRIARDLLMDGDWRAALQFLVRGLEGMDEGVAVAILRGEKRLAGVNRMEVEDEDDDAREALARAAAGLYAGCVRARRPDGSYGYFKPYAWVEDWGPGDVHSGAYARNLYAPDLLSTSTQSMGYAVKFAAEARAVFYMDDRAGDRAVKTRHPEVDGGGLAVVLWAETPHDPPFWVDVPAAGRDEAPGRRKDLAWLRGGAYAELSWDRALSNYLGAGRGLERRGWSWYCARNPDEAERYTEAASQAWSLKRPGAAPEETSESRARARRTYLDVATAAGIDAQAAEGMAAVMSGEADAAPLPEPDRGYAAEYGWLLPDGAYYPCDYYGHRTLAERLMEVRGVEHGGDADKHAGRLNWIKVCRGISGGPEVISCGTRTTRAQREAVEAWGKRPGRAAAAAAWAKVAGLTER